MTYEHLLRSIFRVADDPEGVAFAIDYNLLVTCAHVLTNLNLGPRDRVALSCLADETKIEVEILEPGWCEPDKEDLAFLGIPTADVQGSVSDPLIWLPLGGSKPIVPQRFLTFGVPELRRETVGPSYPFLVEKGDLEALIPWRRSSSYRLQLKSDRIDAGFSGAPVIGFAERRVIGMILEAGAADPQKKVASLAFATPSEAILRACPGLAPSVSMLPALERFSQPRERVYVGPKLDRARYFYGRQEKLALLNTFWEDQSRRVLSLVGMGGSGKTSLVRHFLEEKGWLPLALDSGRREDGGLPYALFAWSFYYDPRMQEFIREAVAFFERLTASSSLGDDSREVRQLHVLSLTALLARTDGRCLLVLDGLEKMQYGGEADLKGSGGHTRGEVRDPSLNRLLNQLINGLCGEAKAIITSRLPLVGLHEWTDQVFEEHRLDDLDPEAAVGLLRANGVHGREAALRHLVSETQFGRHALTVDLLGRLLSKYFDGEPTKAKELPTPLSAVGGSTEIEFKAGKLQRILHAYEEALDELSLETIKAMSVFLFPSRIEIIQRSVLHRVPSSLRAKAADDKFQVRSSLDRMIELGLVDVDVVEGEERFTSHPVIKSYFYSRLQQPADLHREAGALLWGYLKAASGRGNLGGPEVLDVEEAVIQHTKAGEGGSALEIYKDLLGYLSLGWRIGDHSTGFEIAEHLLGVARPEQDRARIEIDRGLYLKNLGSLDESVNTFKGVASRFGVPRRLRAQGLQNLSAVAVLRGRLELALRSGIEAESEALIEKDERLIQDCRVRVATAKSLVGEVENAEELFIRMGSVGFEKEGRISTDWPGLRYGWLLIRQGRTREATQILEECHARAVKMAFGIIVARAQIHLAEATLADMDLEGALRHLSRVHEWAGRAHDQEMVVAGDLAGCRIAMATGQTAEAKRYLEEGKRVAQECGYGLYWIELELVEAELALRAGQGAEAKRLAELVLGGKPGTKGTPGILGAISPENPYPWGEAAALVLLSRTLPDGETATKLCVRALKVQKRLRDSQFTSTQKLLGELRGKATPPETRFPPGSLGVPT